MNRQFNVPSLNEPFKQEFTEMIYDELEQDYGYKNKGKPYNSFIVTRMEIGTSSGYIRSIEEAEREVKKRIEKRLKEKIEATEGYLRRLQRDLDKFNKNGIKEFEV